MKWEQHTQTTLSRNFPAKGRSESAQDLKDLSQGRPSVSLLLVDVITASSDAHGSDSGYGEKYVIIEQKPRMSVYTYLHTHVTKFGQIKP